MFNQLDVQPFTDQEYEDFCQYIYKKVGIHLTDKKRNLVNNRLRKRVITHQYKSFGEYFRAIQRDTNNDEIVHMINAITTNVSSFFREPKQFEVLTNEILPLYRKSGKRLTIWSAGCSTGEEPYTIAMVLLNSQPQVGFQIIATDLSTKVLQFAKDGRYPLEKLKTMDESYLKKYFTPSTNDIYEIKPVVKSNISFSMLNLMGENFPKNLDIIFCRNVIIYFDKPTKDKLFEKFHHSLLPSGYLFLGHSESLFNNSLFKFFRPSVYIRQG